VRVVVNQLAALGLRTGIGHYTVQLDRCLREQALPGEVEGYPRGWVRRGRELAARARPYLEGRRQAVPGTAGPPSLRSRALGHLRHCGRAVMAQHFRTVCRRRGYDLYHEPNFIPIPTDRPTVATLHDLSVLLHPEWHPADRVLYFERHFRRGLADCAHFLAISEFGRQQIIRTLGIPPERVTRTYMGIRPGLAPVPAPRVTAVLHELNLPPQYLLHVGTLEPRKNLLVLLRAYCSLPERVRSRWPLLLVGPWGWNTGAIARHLDDEARHRGVLHLGYAPEQYLPALYSGARALLYPSLYEGFGLPPLEMMACGGAVIASAAGAHVETLGGHAHLLDPDDLDGWRAALLRVVEDRDWWHGLRRNVTAVARPYTWDRCAADTLRVYRSLCGGRDAAPVEDGRRAAA
jgi:glycosyltransferase involved in cell wall biosynthesis